MLTEERRFYTSGNKMFSYLIFLYRSLHEKWLRSLLYPIMFSGRWRPFDGRHRSRSLFDDLRRISYRPDSYHTAPFGSVKIDKRRMLDDDDVSLGRERKLEGYSLDMFLWAVYIQMVHGRSRGEKYLSYWQKEGQGSHSLNRGLWSYLMPIARKRLLPGAVSSGR